MALIIKLIMISHKKKGSIIIKLTDLHTLWICYKNDWIFKEEHHKYWTLDHFQPAMTGKNLKKNIKKITTVGHTQSIAQNWLIIAKGRHWMKLTRLVGQPLEGVAP